MNSDTIVECPAESRLGVAEWQVEVGGRVSEFGGEAIPVGGGARVLQSRGGVAPPCPW